jgi:hypothetical protein
LQGHPPLELSALDDFAASEIALFESNGTVEALFEAVISLVSFMSRLRFTFMDKFLTSALLVGMVKLALVMFKWLVALTFAIASFSPTTAPNQIAAKSKINIPNFMYLSILTPVIRLTIYKNLAFFLKNRTWINQAEYEGRFQTELFRRSSLQCILVIQDLGPCTALPKDK